MKAFVLERSKGKRFDLVGLIYDPLQKRGVMGIKIEMRRFRKNRFGSTENGHKGEGDVIVPVGKIGVEGNGKGGGTESSLIAGSATSFRKAGGERGERRFRGRHAGSKGGWNIIEGGVEKFC